MKTDDLIAALARETEAAPPANSKTGVAAAIAAGLVVAAALLASAGMVRPDIGAALGPILAKAAFASAFAAAALPALMRLARPGKPMARALWALAGLCAVSAVAVGIALIGTDSADRLRMWLGGGMPLCLVAIPILAAPAAIGLFAVLRGLAPTSLAAAGAAIGAVSGGIGAMAYALYCPVDSIAFVATWYSAAIALCAAIGAFVGARLLRW